MKKLNKIAMRMRKIAKPMEKLSWDNLSGDLTPQNWRIFLNGIANPKIKKYLDDNVNFDADGKLENPKMTDSMVQGFNYADEMGLDDKRTDYLIAYSDARKTTDQLGDFYKSLKRITNLLSKADDDMLPATAEDFVALTAKSGNTKNAFLTIDKLGISKSEDEILLDLMLYCSEFCNNDYKNHNLTDCIIMAYAYNASEDNIASYLSAKQQEPLHSLKSGPLKQTIRKRFAEGNTNDDDFQFVLNNCDKLDKPHTNAEKNLGIKLLSDSTPEDEKKAIKEKVVTTAKRMARNKIFTRMAQIAKRRITK